MHYVKISYYPLPNNNKTILNLQGNQTKQHKKMYAREYISPLPFCLIWPNVCLRGVQGTWASLSKTVFYDINLFHLVPPRNIQDPSSRAHAHLVKDNVSWKQKMLHPKDKKSKMFDTSEDAHLKEDFKNMYIDQQNY